MWWLAWNAARADQLATPAQTCAAPTLVSTLPAEGDVGVLPGAVITLVHQTGPSTTPCFAASFEGELLEEGTVPVGFTQATDAGSLVVTVIPDEPLRVGATYLLQGITTGGDLSLSFTVGEEGLPMTEPPVEVRLDAQRRCGSFPFTMLDLVVRFDEPRSGLLQTEVLTDGISAGWTTIAAIDGRSEYTASSSVLSGGHEHCVETRLLDEVGGVVWEADGDCVTTRPCPAAPRPAASCATVGGWSAAGWMSALAGLSLRRSRRRPSC